MCSEEKARGVLGDRTRWAMAPKRAAPTPIKTSGRSWAKCGSMATKRGKLLSATSILAVNIAAISLKARY